MKRILSLLLSVCMVISMLPAMAIFASAEKVTVSDNFLFTAPSHGFYALTAMYNSTTLGTDFTTESNKGGISGKWSFVNQASGSTVSADINNFLWTVNIADTASPDFDGTQATVRTIIFEVSPSETGSFVPNVSFLTENSGGKYDVLFFEAPGSSWQCPTIAYGNKAIRNNIAAKYATTKIGSFDAYGNGELKTVSFDKVSVDSSKKYYLAFILNGANEKTKKDIYSSNSRYFYTLKLRSFSLSSGAIIDKSEIVYDITPNSYQEDAIANYATLQTSTASSQGGVIDNLELMYVSYKEKISGVTPMIDLAKTEGFELFGRSPKDSSPVINDVGYSAQLVIASDSTGNNYEAESYGSRPWMVMKINVPYGGKFKLSTVNAFTKAHSVVAGVVSLGEQKNGAVKGIFDKGAVAKVYFGNVNFEPTNKATSGAITNGALFGDFVTVADEVGFYDSNNLATDENSPYITDVGYIEVPKAGEYYLFFDIDEDSIAHNAKSWYRSSNTYQLFLLSGIKLTPVDETKTSYTRIDLNGTHTIGKDKTALSTWNTYGFDIVDEKTTTNIARKSAVALANGMSLPYQQIQIPGDPWQNRAEEDRVNAMFTIRKHFSASGYYSIEMLGYKWYAGSDFAVYVNGEYAGDYNHFEADAALSVGEKKKLNTLYIPQGDIEISFRTKVKHYATPNLIPIWMEFTPVDGTLEVEDVIVSEYDKIIVGNADTFNAKVKMSDGSYRGFGLSDDASEDSKNKISVSSEDDSIVEISNIEYAKSETETDIAFTTNAKSIGNTNLKINVNIDGVQAYTKIIPVEIIPVPELTEVKLSVSKSTLPKTRTATATYELIGADGKEWTEPTDVTFKTTNDGVLNVEENDGVISLTAIGEGETDLYILASSQGKPEIESNRIAVTVTPEPILSSISVAAESAVLIPGSETKTILTGMMDDDVEAVMNDYAVTYKSSNSEVAEINSETGAIVAVSAGLSVITAETVNEEGDIVSAKFTLNVYDTLPSFEVDFSQSKYNGDDGNGNRLAPTTTPGYTIVMEESDTKHWRLGACADTGFSVAYIRTNGGVWPATKEITNNAVTILVDVPYEYDWAITLHGGVWNVGGVYSVFVDDQYAGDINCYDPTSSNFRDAGELRLNTLHLKAGQRKISFRVRKKNYSSGKIGILCIGKIIFDPVTESGTTFAKMNVEAPVELAVGEKFDATAFVEMTDGSALHYGINNDGINDEDIKISVRSENETVLKVSGFANYTMGKTGKIPFEMTAVSTGDADEVDVNVVVDATIDGNIQEPKTVTVKVKNDSLASVIATTAAEEIFLGDSTKLIAKTMLESGREINRENAPVSYFTENTDVVEIAGDTLNTLAVGTATIRAEATFAGVTKTYEFDIEVLPEGLTDLTASSGGSPRIRLTDDSSDKYPLVISATTNLGNNMDLSDAEIEVMSITPEIATVEWETYPDENGIPGYYISPVSEGSAEFDITVTVNGRTRTKRVELPVVKAKIEASYMTDEKRDIARENIKKYDWAKSQANEYIKKADKYIEYLDEIYALVASQEIPRSFSVGAEKDPNMYHCRYCGVNLQTEYGNYPWVHNSISRPWKIQCPDCKRIFPSNDFGKFYELGLNEYGEFIYMDALEAHREMLIEKGEIDLSVTAPGKQNSKTWKAYYGYGAKSGYLTNNLYTNLAENKTINCGQGLRDGETEETWGVDDGYGYVPSKEDGTAYLSGTVAERHLYIAEFMHYGVFHNKTPDSNGGVLTNAIVNCAYAYYFTGEAKYGRVAAILLDRVADFYRGYDIKAFGNDVWNSDGGSNQGKRLGCIWECSILTNELPAYDMVYELYEDDAVIKYIKEHNTSRYSKQTAAQIRQNVEDNFIRGALDEVYNRKVHGNFGMSQRIVAMAAVILDSFPETNDWIDYLMAPGWTTNVPVVGGGINEVLIEKVCADGHSNEASDYGLLWLSGISMVNNVLSGYDKYDGMKLSDHPKYQQMFLALLPLRAANSYSAQIGDGGNTADLSHWANTGHMKSAFVQTGDPIFAQYMYMLNGDSTEGFKHDIYTKNPESLAGEVQKIVDQYGTLTLDSDIQTGFGYSILRDGDSYENNITDATAMETTRNVWMYFGSNAVSHAHLDTLNIGMTAFGLNVLPDLGYPEQTGNDPNRIQWVRNTISHNTVVVNEEKQKDNSEIRGRVKHFDDAENVQVIDVDASYVYPDTETYRRSVVMINVDDENSYYVDLFRVLGGNSHIYSFHAQSNEIAETSGLSMVPQTDDSGNYAGTYAGVDTEYGNDPDTVNSAEYKTKYPIGYTWFKNVDRDENPQDKIEIDFAIKDFNKAVKDSKNIHLRMTMLNSSNVQDGANVNVAIADGYAPRIAANKNIDKLKYVLVENENKDAGLNTVFTTILEPYKEKRIIKNADELELVVKAGKKSESDAARAVRVELENGRVDYVFYSTNNTVTYSIEDNGSRINFRGFVGVYSVKDGQNIYKYVLDGDIIGTETNKKAGIVGSVTSFTKEISHNNVIELKTDSLISDDELSDLVNRVVIIDNDADMRDAAYKILGASRNGDNILLDLGKVTLIRKYVDMYNEDLGYVYTIAEGQEAYIPLSLSDNHDPVFESISDNITTSSGSTVKVDVNASSDLDGVTVKYQATSLPRGAILNEESGVITWKPTSSQIGANHFAVTAVDSDGRESTIHFVITVYGSTTGTVGSGNSASTGTSGGGNSGGGAGGSGGSGTTTPSKPAEPEKPVESETPTESESQETEEKTFTDLGSHAWAEDAINALAKEGIIKGTSSTTYSPAANITRADFAILLVRAFELESDSTENFADVADSDYFAKELAIARNNGIINGVGDNKYAPRNTITRQDMMTIVYRAMVKLGIELKKTTDTEMPDTDAVANYAEEAVSALIGAGLVNGKSGKIAPTDYTTRAEVAVLLKRILDYSK